MLRIPTDTLMCLSLIMMDTRPYHALAKKHLAFACIFVYFINYTSQLKLCKYSSHAKYKEFGEYHDPNEEKLLRIPAFAFMYLLGHGKNSDTRESIFYSCMDSVFTGDIFLWLWRGNPRRQIKGREMVA